MNYYKIKEIWTIIILTSAIMMISCAGNPPSISNYMNEGFVKSAQITTWTGDLINEDADSIDGPYIHEQPLNIDVGLYYGEKFRYGIEAGITGINGIIGLKNDNFGVLSWVNLNRAMTGGLAIAQQLKMKETQTIGVFEYVSKNSISKFDQSEVGRMQNGSYTYGEYGFGLYYTISFYEPFSLSLETKYGNQIKDSRERIYLRVNIIYK